MKIVWLNTRESMIRGWDTDRNWITPIPGVKFMIPDDAKMAGL